jgi:NAD(P)-dependent dehydrogenase (short-subunit alcohol dehydrogenase family)
MITNQTPVGSPFNAESTARDVIENFDLKDRLAVVTGGYSGLGLEITKALTGAGATVIVPARRPNIAHDALHGLPNVMVQEMDLGDISSVRTFSDAIISSGQKIDILINNAGVMATDLGYTKAGIEQQFGINHLGHYALVNFLWPILNDGCRIIAVSSAGHHFSDVKWDDYNFNDGYDKWEAYGQAKTANILFALQLAKYGAERNIQSYSLHPGAILTPLQRHLSRDEMVALGWVDENGNCADPTFKTPPQGAATAVWAATSSLLNNISGVYCEDCEVSVVSDSTPFKGVRSYAVSPDSADRLWKLSTELTGVNVF